MGLEMKVPPYSDPAWDPSLESASCHPRESEHASSKGQQRAGFRNGGGCNDSGVTYQANAAWNDCKMKAALCNRGVRYKGTIDEMTLTACGKVEDSSVDATLKYCSVCGAVNDC